MPPGALLVSLAVVTTTLAGLALLWGGPKLVPAMAAGLVLQALSLVLFWRAVIASHAAGLHFAFDTEPPVSLVRLGPYRVVRHPFYTSYLLFWMGLAIASWSPWSVLLVVLMAAIYVSAARGEERKFAATGFADAYQVYRHEVGMFWPRRTR
jgi:protein-S-isoprenylcysteine O-methyltransferase Ste14